MTLTRNRHRNTPGEGVTTASAGAASRLGVQAGRIAEAVGYLGGVLGGVGAVLLVHDLWAELGSGVRLGLPAITLLALLLAAHVAGRMAATRVLAAAAPVLRLRTFLWLAAIATAGATAAVTVSETFEQPSDHDITLAAFVGVLVVAVGLWRGLARPVPQAIALGSGLVTVGVGFEDLSTSRIGLTVFLVATALALLGLARQTSSPWITLGVGALGALVGAGMMSEDWRTLGLVVVDVVVFAALAIALLRALERTLAERNVLLGAAFIGAWMGVPQSLTWFTEGSAYLTGLGVWLTGAVVVAAAHSALTRAPRTVQGGGALLLVGGAALTGADSVAVAVIAGLATALVLLALGAAPHRMTLSMVGVVGLLIDVPWAILHFLPGERRAPVAIVAAGLVLVAAALYVIRRSNQIKS